MAHKFAQDLQHGAPAMGVICVASRSAESAVRFVAGLSGAQAASSYAEAAARADVDAVYIATPPSVHEEHALLAIAAGKAVLIEKPFAPDAASARRIAQAAQAASVFCMEAMWTRFLPMVAQARAHVAARALGEIRQLQGSFGISSAADPASSLFDSARGGGP